MLTITQTPATGLTIRRKVLVCGLVDEQWEFRKLTARSGSAHCQ